MTGLIKSVPFVFIREELKEENDVQELEGHEQKRREE
jgi:hypothetical protein